MTDSASSYIIVGAGVFGASTALHLIKKYPFTTVTLIDRTIPCQVAASWDWSKVIRADYTNNFYMKMALEAMEFWRTDPLYQQFYHESGLVWVDDRGFAQTVIDNYRQLKVIQDVRITGPDEIKKLYGGIFRGAELNNLSEILINRSCGWVEAIKALEEVIKVAVAAGVRCVEVNIASVAFDDGGVCVSVRSVNEQIFTAPHVILATGAGTAKLIADGAPDREDLQVGARLTASAIFTARAKVNEEAAGLLRTGPVFLHAVGKNQACFPVNSDNILKVARDVSFMNTSKHSSERLISITPAGPDYNQWNLSARMMDELRLVSIGIFGKTFDFDSGRICWDAVAPNQDFLICAHPHPKNLFLATGGSFHAWKFLPTLGKYVIEMLEGKLDPSSAKRWAWGRDESGATS